MLVTGLIVLAAAGSVFAYNNTCIITNPYTQEYVTGHGNIIGNVDAKRFSDIDERFAIGAGADGRAVFKNPKEAFNALTENYADGILLIKSEFDLPDLNQRNYDVYGEYGWQVNGGTDEEREQADFVSDFMDIYENSFK